MKKFYVILFIGFLVFSQKIQSQLNILLVNDNNLDLTRIEKLKTSLNNLGYSYTYYNCATELASPSLILMQAHNLVIWYTGNDGVGLYFWNGTDTENQAIKDYIDGGGMFWLQGLDFLYDKYSAAPDNFSTGQMVYDYLGIATYAAQSYSDDGSLGVAQLDVVSGNGIFTLNPVQWSYATMYYVDALVPIAGASSVYSMGPTGYVLDDYFAAVYYEKGDGKVLSFTFETARINTQTNMDTLFSQGLQYFEEFTYSVVYVSDITVSGQGGVTSINVNQGTLQMIADIQPPNATNPTIVWSVIEGTTSAKIDQNGLLKASGTSLGNGTVWVKALAIDGSGVSDSLMITITNQGSDFQILLVNDNANTINRYREIDTTLSNLNCAYDFYNTVETGTYPDFLTLTYYDVVIWYTGNDGVDLKLWDVSNAADYKFNAPLISYLNVGGIVWLQGLDFFYDVYGSAPDIFTAGQFVYDFMGVSSYAAQTYTDDGNIGVAQLDLEAGNPDPICTITPIEWIASTLWYADGMSTTPSAYGVYRMGPPGYVLDTYLAGVYNENGLGKILTFSFETAWIDTQTHTDTLFSQVLSYFEEKTSGEIPVTDITVYGAGGSTSINTNNGTLQMNTIVQPANATNKVVYWSVVNGTGIATINQNGLLQATGFSAGNGTVWVKANATDGSGFSDLLMITISNQGSDFEILFVNDNNYSDRYLEVDSTLTNLGYTYYFYNTATLGDSPDYSLMNNFDVVIWYTGNDGTDLKLWDITNTSDYKFNNQLIQYLDDGGIVWLQGLDFMYDVFGDAPDSFVAGQFIYDYMGISNYAAQSYTDDGSVGVAQLDVVPGNSLCSFTPILWTTPTLHFADGFEITPGAEGIYKMGPTEYVFSNYYSGVFKETVDAKLFTLAVETARVNTEINTDTLFSQVLEAFRTINQTTFTVNIKVFLEGPYNQTEMKTDLNDNLLLPLEQPYKVSPWNYGGNESVGAIPNESVVDWVLVEMRDASSASAAIPSTRLSRKAAFLLNNGSIVDLDGSSVLTFSNTISEQLFVIVWHRNHLGILSANPLSGFNNVYSYNFTDAMNKAYGTEPQKSLGGGKYGMYGGDFNADGIINDNDKTQIWTLNAGNSGYFNGDGNLSIQSNNLDKNQVWYINRDKQCQIPQ
jgi:hypothetical protein